MLFLQSKLTEGHEVDKKTATSSERQSSVAQSDINYKMVRY